LHRAKQGPKLFTHDEVRRLLDANAPALKAMVLLGINCGFGNADCGKLPISTLDLAGGWVTFPRPKTGIARRCPVWPETIGALRAVLAKRPEPKNGDDAGLVFITKYGRSWAEATSTVTHEMTKLLRALDINGRNGLGFYTLRHTFRTMADEARAQPAADLTWGMRGTIWLRCIASGLAMSACRPWRSSFGGGFTGNRNDVYTAGWLGDWSALALAGSYSKTATTKNSSPRAQNKIGGRVTIPISTRQMVPLNPIFDCAKGEDNGAKKHANKRKDAAVVEPLANGELEPPHAVILRVGVVVDEVGRCASAASGLRGAGRWLGPSQIRPDDEEG
jgi:hypothetical protein